MAYINPLTGKPGFGSKNSRKTDESSASMESFAPSFSSEASKPLDAVPRKPPKASDVLEKNREKWADLFLAKLFYDYLHETTDPRRNKLTKLGDKGIASFIHKTLSGDVLPELRKYVNDGSSLLDVVSNIHKVPDIPLSEREYADDDVWKELAPAIDEFREKLRKADRLSDGVVTTMLRKFENLDATEEDLGPYMSREDAASQILDKFYAMRGLGKPSVAEIPPEISSVVERYARFIPGGEGRELARSVGNIGKDDLVIQRAAARKAWEDWQPKEIEKNKVLAEIRAGHEKIAKETKERKERKKAEQQKIQKRRDEEAEIERKKAAIRRLKQEPISARYWFSQDALRYADEQRQREKEGRPYQYDDYEAAVNLGKRAEALGVPGYAKRIVGKAELLLEQAYPELFDENHPFNAPFSEEHPFGVLKERLFQNKSESDKGKKEKKKMKTVRKHSLSGGSDGKEKE